MKWFNDLSGVEQIFFSLAVISTLFVIIEVIALFSGRNGKVVQTKSGEQKVRCDSALTSRSAIEMGAFFTLLGWLVFALYQLISFYAFIPAVAMGVVAVIIIELVARKKYAHEFNEGTADLEEIELTLGIDDEADE